MDKPLNANAANIDFPPIWSLIAVSAELAAKHPGHIEDACAGTLHGKTDSEPDLESAVYDISLRGFHVWKGTVWGLHMNQGSDSLEMVRLGNAE